MKKERTPLLQEGYQKERRRRRGWRGVVAVLGCFVAAGTIGALTLPAITMNKPACGIEEHQHSEDCYGQSALMVCTAESRGVHQHTENCDGGQNCYYADFEIHEHEAGCKDSYGNMICQLPEIEEHAHNDSCYKPGPDKVIVEGHTHTDACYEMVKSTEPTCNQEAAEKHYHDGNCYVQEQVKVCEKPTEASHTEECYDENGTLICELAEHAGHEHTPECYKLENVLHCEKKETEGHDHTEECYGMVRGTKICNKEERQPVTEPGDPVLICKKPEIIAHKHEGDCFYTDPETKETYLVCTQREVLSHQHTASCWEPRKVIVCGLDEHEHDEKCDQAAELTEEEKQQVDDLIFMIGAMPSAEQIEDELAKLKDDEAELTAYCEKTLAQLREAFEIYNGLTEGQQAAVTNAAKLLDCEYLLEILAAYIPPVEPDYTAEFVSSRYGKITATVMAEPGVVPEGARFTLGDGSDPDAGGKVQGFLDTLGVELLDMAQLEMHFEADGEVVQPTGSVTVTLNFENPIFPGEGSIFMLHLTDSEAENVTDHVVRDEDGVHEVTFNTSGFSTYAMTRATAATTVTVTDINHVSWSGPYVIVLHNSNGGTVAGCTGVGTSTFQYNTVIAVEPENGVLKVKEVNSANESKRDMSVAAGGFFVVYNPSNVGAIGVEPGDTVTASSDFWNTNQQYGYNASGYGTLTFTSSAEAYLRPDKNNNVPTVESADTSQIINVNLYNYGSNINEKWRNDYNYPGFQYPGGATTGGLGRWNMDYGDNIVADTTDNEWINVTGADAPGGAVNGNGKDFIEGAIGKTLGSDGYPVLAYDNSSLSWLFSNNTYATKQNSANINGLFRYNPTNGEYYYDSRTNHAQYANNTFTLYDAWISSNFIMYPFGNFLPFNNINTETTHAPEANRQWFLDVAAHAQYQYNNGADERYNTLAAAIRDMVRDMDDRYPEGWGAEQAVREYFKLEGLQNSDKPVGVLPNIYSIDYDLPTDFFFGMDMDMTFMMPKDGITGPYNNYDMVFRFVGDDDVWVYIDDVLFLDLTGIHRHKGGTIDFVHGVVSYYDLDPATGDISTTPSKTYTFKQLLEAAGKDSSVLNGKGTFKDYTTHTFKFYFMERGSGSSVCKMNFNFPLLRQNSITVGKELTVDDEEKRELLGDPDFRFQVLKDGVQSKQEIDPDTDLFIGEDVNFDIVDANNKVIDHGVTGPDGIFVLKAGERAVFSGINENSDRYFVRELLDTDAFQQYGKVTVSGSSETTATGTDVTIGNSTFKGLNGPVQDVSNGSTLFIFENHVDFHKLGSLEINKVLADGSTADENTEFSFTVTLDGKPIPVGTKYTVRDTGTDASDDDEEKNVATDGIITLKAGQTAKISKILAGSQFTVQETSDSALGYTVTYAGGTVETTEEKGTYVSGEIKVNTAVAVEVTNAERGTEVELPGVKNLTNPDGEEHTFTFNLTEVSDSTGKTAVVNGLTQTATATFPAENGGTTADFKFVIPYLERNFTGEGTLPKTFYYKVTEQTDSTAVKYDETVYIAEVIVDKAENGNLTANVTKFWKNGEEQSEPMISADFTNTLLSSLTIEKVIAGVTPADTEFTFQVTVKQEDTPVSGKYPYKLTQKDSSEPIFGTLILDTNGTGTVKLKGGQSVTIQDLPSGASWTVRETNADGYTVTYKIGDAEVVAGNEANGTLPGEVSVVFTNEMHYALPEAGGTGTFPYIFSGLALTGAAALMYISALLRKRRKGAR